MGTMATKVYQLNSYYKNKKVLVIGGAGFIGSNLSIKLVELGAKVSIVDALLRECGGNLFNLSKIKNRIRFYHGDINKLKNISYVLGEADVIFNCIGFTNHLASIKDPLQDLKLNVSVHLQLLLACKNSNISARIVYLASRSQYGRSQSKKIKETHPICPLDFHGAHKAMGEIYHTLFNTLYGVDARILRVTNVYGPRQDMRNGNPGIINKFIKEMMEGERILIFGSGNRVKDFLYVDDVVDAILHLAMKKDVEHRVYNLGGNPVAIEEVVRAIISILGRGKYEVVPFPKSVKAMDTGDVILDSSRIKNEFGWKSNVKLHEGVKDTIVFYLKNKKYYW
jgi:UDP-glucose 4-epimerase